MKKHLEKHYKSYFIIAVILLLFMFFYTLSFYPYFKNIKDTITLFLTIILLLFTASMIIIKVFNFIANYITRPFRNKNATEIYGEFKAEGPNEVEYYTVASIGFYVEYGMERNSLPKRTFKDKKSTPPRFEKLSKDPFRSDLDKFKKKCEELDNSKFKKYSYGVLSILRFAFVLSLTTLNNREKVDYRKYLDNKFTL